MTTKNQLINDLSGTTNTDISTQEEALLDKKQNIQGSKAGGQSFQVR